VDRRAIGDYLTHGILAPARDMLTRHPDDQIRLSILSPDDDAFRMEFWAGHDLTSAKKFTIPIKDSISRVAFESGTTETWDDVHDDDRYAEHPKATRPTRAMVSVPLTHGSEVIGVFNAISDQPRGFNPADRLYIECLGSVIDVAVGILHAGHLVDTTD
jgi:GAF domain-containing protein